jgi:MinD superfamily P-loop ATPase
VTLCPEKAIAFPDRLCGRWYVSETRFAPLVHAQLGPGEENSGRLVALLRQQAKTLADTRGADLILSDGPPGIGCPAISALSGATQAVVVTEPTPSGRHDLARALELCRHFDVPASVIINKWDVNARQAERIQKECDKAGLAVLARLSHDPEVVKAMVAGRTVIEHGRGKVVHEIQQAWDSAIKWLKEHPWAA